MQYRLMTDETGQPYLEVHLTNYALLATPLLNKGMAFTYAEREAFNLFGLIPPTVATLKDQHDRSYESFSNKLTDLEKYIYLRDLQDSNETLFYNLLVRHITEMLPIVYTPTVGLGCQKLSHVYRRQRGLYIAYPYREHITQILSSERFDHVQVIVVTDGERILGLGDLGAGGIGISIGKLALYSACAGIHPDATLPIMLDVGTNNQDLLNDPLYIGWRHERLRGKAYDDFILQFITAVKQRYPHIVLQWEDFAQQNAYRILQQYQNQLCTFNDDIQGTAAVTTATLLAAVKSLGGEFKQQQIVVVGAGSAGCGISRLIMQVMMAEGLSEAEALSRFYLVDRYGLLTEDMPDLLSFQRPFAKAKAATQDWQHSQNGMSLYDVLNNITATVLIGVSGQPGIFSEEAIRLMASKVARPIIFPLSNPTERAEATPTDLMQWTEDRVIMGTGSPFADVIKNGKPFRVDQTNNSYIFPGLGLGLIAIQAKQVTEAMLIAAAQALAATSPAKLDPNQNLLPAFDHIREVSLQIALAVAQEALQSGLAGRQLRADEDLETLIRSQMWEPHYLPYKKPNGDGHL